MSLKEIILLIILVNSVAAQDLEPSTTENLIDFFVADALETDALGTIDYIDPLETSDALETGSLGTTDYIDPVGALDPIGQVPENVPKNFLISWLARRSLRRILAQMPCGWPEYGIPSLAPYENEGFTFKMENSVLNSETNLKPLRIDGLNDMEINRLKVGVVVKSVNFDFNFPNITFTSNFDTLTALNLHDVMAFNLSLKGEGTMQLTLENLRIKGDFKYKLPIFFGSAKIEKINVQVRLGNANSELSGSLNGIPIGDKINDFIVTQLLAYLNEHDYLWNGLFEQHVLPLINTQLEGQTLWKIFLWSITRVAKTCTPDENLNEVDIIELHQLLLKQQQPLLENFVRKDNKNGNEINLNKDLN